MKNEQDNINDGLIKIVNMMNEYMESNNQALKELTDVVVRLQEDVFAIKDRMPYL